MINSCWISVEYIWFIWDEAGVTLSVCQLIKKKSPRTKVLYPSDVGYDESINHYAVSSTQRSLCSVLPSTSDDVATIVNRIELINVIVFICIFSWNSLANIEFISL